MITQKYIQFSEIITQCLKVYIRRVGSIYFSMASALHCQVLHHPGMMFLAYITYHMLFTCHVPSLLPEKDSTSDGQFEPVEDGTTLNEAVYILSS